MTIQHTVMEYLDMFTFSGFVGETKEIVYLSFVIPKKCGFLPQGIRNERKHSKLK